MKIKEGFLLRQVAGKNVVLPGGDLDLNMMITLNETGAFLWEKLQSEKNEQELIGALLEEYDVEETVAAKAVSAFIQKLNDHGFLA